MKKITTLIALFMFSVAGFSQTAKVQIIHNSGDELLKRIDVYQNTSLMADSLQFRYATPFMDVPANAPVVFTVQSPSLPDTSNALHHDTLMLDADSSYVLITSGIISNTSFYDSLKPFKLALHRARSQATGQGDVDVLFYNGASEAPELTIDEALTPIPMLIDSLPYGQFSPYLSLSPADYVFDVIDGRTKKLLARYSAPFSTLGLADSAMVILSSGFLDTLKSNPGDTSERRVAKFGLYAALPAGGPLYRLPVLSDLSIRGLHLTDFKVYPNPVRGILNIEAGSRLTGITITDMGGREVKRLQPAQVAKGLVQIETSSLRAGIYLLRMEDGDGKVAVQQIAIKR